MPLFNQHTFLCKQRTQPPRWTLCSPSPLLCNHFSVLQDSGLLSDHLPLLVRMDNHSSSQQTNTSLMQRKREKWRSKESTEEQWATFRSLMAPHLAHWQSAFPSSSSSSSSLPPTSSTLNTLANGLRDIIQRAALQAIGKKAILPGRYKTCFKTHGPELRSLIDNIRTARNTYQFVRSTCLNL